MKVARVFKSVGCAPPLRLANIVIASTAAFSGCDVGKGSSDTDESSSLRLFVAIYEVL